MNNTVDSSIPSATLAPLRALRDATPKLAENLKPSPAPDQSGLILDTNGMDWGIAMPGESPLARNLALPSFSENDARYWEPIASFDENGHITSLLLGRQRLQTVRVDLLLPLLDHVIELDLAGTYLPVSAMTRVLDHCSAGLTHLYLGGNALGDDGIITLAPHFPKTVQLLDLRYNNIGATGAAALADDYFLQNASCACEKLYLEGNVLGDAGAKHVAVTGPIRELYLGQNKIGANGASALAQGLKGGRLKKLFLETNHIGAAGAISLRRALEDLGEGQAVTKPLRGQQ